MVGFALEQAEHGEEMIPNTAVRVGGKFQGRHEALLEPVNAVGPEALLQDGEVLERLGYAAGTCLTELRRLLLGGESRGELADERVQADAVLQELLDESDVV